MEYHIVVGRKSECQIQSNATLHAVLSAGTPCKLYRQCGQDSTHALRWMSAEEGEAPEEIGQWEGILGSDGINTTIIHGLVHLVMHKFLQDYTQGKKLGNAVAWTSAALMRLHLTIFYTGITSLLFFACS